MRVRPLFRAGLPHSAGAPLKFQSLKVWRPDYRPAVNFLPASYSRFYFKRLPTITIEDANSLKIQNTKFAICVQPIC
jgi:hypothetical protein